MLLGTAQGLAEGSRVPVGPADLTDEQPAWVGPVGGSPSLGQEAGGGPPFSPESLPAAQARIGWGGVRKGLSLYSQQREAPRKFADCSAVKS